MYLLSYLVMATIPNTPLIPTSPSTSEDIQTSGTNLEEINTEDEMNTWILVNGQIKKERSYNI